MTQARSNGDPPSVSSPDPARRGRHGTADRWNVSGAWNRVSAGERPDDETLSDTVLTTLLMSDLVESTSLFEHLGDERATALLRHHDRQARDLVAVHGGREIDKTDGFLLLFDRPIGAVIYAQAYHQMLEELSKEEGVELSARVGVHVGEVILYENSLEDVARGAKPLEVEGLAKPVVSRLMSLATRRQTLVSRSVYEMTRRRLSDTADSTGTLLWMTHGDYWFKGVDDPIEVIEIGRAGFSPLKAPPSSDKARHSSVTALPEGRALQGEKRPRLAARTLAVLAMLAVSLGLGLFLLARFGFPLGASPRDRPTISVLGFKNSSRQSETDWISTAFSEMLRTELAAGEKLQIVPGESVARMKIELELPEVDALAPETLAKVGKNLGTDYVVLGSYFIHGTGTNRPIRLDFRLQDTATGDTLVSHFQMGREDELFTMVSDTGSYLRGKLGVEAISDAQAEAVRATVSENPEAMRLYSRGLEQMHRYNALGAQELLAQAVEADPEYALAHAALSEAWSKLGHDREAEKNAKRALELARDLPRQELLLIHGRFYEASGDGDPAVEAYAELWRNYPDNVEYGLLLVRAELLASRGPAALETVEELRRLPKPSGSDPRIDLAEAFVAHQVSNYETELAAARRAEEKGRERDAKTLVAEALWRQGTALNILGNFDEAEAALEESRRIFDQVGDLGNAARVMNIYGLQLEEQGHFSRAEDVLERALEIHRRTGNRKYVSVVASNVALLKKKRGELAAAWKLLEEALSIAREIGDRRREALRQVEMSSVLLDQGSVAESEEWLHAGLETGKDVDHQIFLADSSRQLARFSLLRGQLEDAEQAYGQALEVCREIGTKHLHWQVQNELGELLLLRGDLAGARDRLRQAEAIRSDLGGPLATVRMNQAALLLAEGKPGEAEALARRAVAELEPEGRRDEAVLASALLVRALTLQEKLAEARDVVAETREKAATSENPRVRLFFSIAAALSQAAAGELAAARDEAAKLGMKCLELEARLALAQVELASAERAGTHERLRALAGEAEELGFGLLARKARDVLR